MNIQVLIDSTVRQVTVLIAQLATSGGVRAPLAHVANQVFVELARELETQGVSRKVSADMFGMALRAYIRKVRRLTESKTEGGVTLWQAVLEFIRVEEMVTRSRVLERFGRDGEMEVSSILKDLRDTGMVFCTGAGVAAIYRATTTAELGHFSELSEGDGLDEFAWALIFRQGPLSLRELAGLLSKSDKDTDCIVQRLKEAGRVQLEADRLVAREFVVPLGSALGWEASVFDHVQAMVQTICQRLEEMSGGTDSEGVVGGSTYSFDVWPQHPLYDEVRSQLAEQRARLSELRVRVEEHNYNHGSADRVERVVSYVGQCVLSREAGEK